MLIMMRVGRRVSALLIPVVVLSVCSWLLLFQSRPFSGRVPGASQPVATPAAVEIVVASLSTQNTSWVHSHLPGWLRSVYVVDDPSAKLTVPKNKGHEAMVYLSHIIDRYDTLSETTVFVHAHRFAWHNDDPDYDAVPALRNLNLDYVQSSGYVNLRCVWWVGCPVEIHPHTDAATTASARRDLTVKPIYKQYFEELMPGVEVPQQVGVSCCSQFAVSREAVRRRPRGDYVRWRDWLLETPLADELSGRMFEYLWHVIFGKDAVFCPPAAECYCKLYGHCELACKAGTCDGRYFTPKSAALPDGWPRIGWSGEERNYTGLE